MVPSRRSRQASATASAWSPPAASTFTSPRFRARSSRTATEGSDMFDALIRGSLRRPWLVLGAALLLIGLGLLAAKRLPVDVLPDLSAPSVTIVTETQGLAPEEAEKLITLPIEQS